MTNTKYYVPLGLEVLNTINSWNKKGATNFIACIKEDEKNELGAIMIFTFKGKIKWAGYKGQNFKETRKIYDVIEKEIENFYDK